MAVIQCMCPKAFVFMCPTGSMAPLILLIAQERIESQAAEGAHSKAEFLSFSSIFICTMYVCISNTLGIAGEKMKVR